MDAFELMAEPIRRRLIEILASGTHDTGNLEALITNEFGVSRAAVHHHLKVLREHDVVRADWDWPYRSYELLPFLFADIEQVLEDLLFLYQARVGGRFPGDPVLAVRRTRRGRRGHGVDPDDPWRRAAEVR